MSFSIGVVANPASGKDVRRLVAHASVFGNREKAAIVARAITGAVNAGGRSFAYVDDSHNIAASAMQILPACCSVRKVEGCEDGYQPRHSAGCRGAFKTGLYRNHDTRWRWHKPGIRKRLA